jgi:hypothetical protein
VYKKGDAQQTAPLTKIFFGRNHFLPKHTWKENEGLVQSHLPEAHLRQSIPEKYRIRR